LDDGLDIDIVTYAELTVLTGEQYDELFGKLKKMTAFSA